MAAPPTRRKLTTEDVPGAPDWLERLIIPLNAMLTPVAGGLTNGLTFAENFAGEVREVTLTPEDDWVLLSGNVANGWTETVGDRSRLSARKDSTGRVYLRGSLTHGGAPVAGAVAVNWPSGFAPAARHSIDSVTNTGIGVLDAYPTGLLWYSGGPGNVAVDQVQFDAADRTPPRWTSPVDVKLGTPQRPFPGKAGQVLVLGARQSADATLPVVVTGLDWTPLNLEKQKASPGIRIHRAWGLVPGVKYILTLLVLPE